jgi:hypothetical protein
LSRFEIVPRGVVPDLRDTISCHFDQREILHRVLRGPRSYNSRIYQGIAIQARDGATSAELQGVAETAMAAWPGVKANRKRRT